jgi:hypothetical protein
MAEVTTTRTELPEFLEAAAKPYLTELTTAVGGLKGADLSKVYGPQFVAGQDPLSQQAVSIATGAQGLGSYQPFLETAAARTGPDAYQAFMSPYQRDVIQTALQDFDIQAQKGLGSVGQAAYQAGAFGGGRQGVAEAEYQAASDRNRAALQAQLLQQGFGQAQQAAGADFARQLSLAQSSPALAGQQISGLQTLGGAAQTQRQSELAAQQQLAQQQLLQPLQAAQALGGGITGLIAGYPTQQTTIAPSPSMAQTALSAGATLAGIYGALR